jgi:hypothetical protein
MPDAAYERLVADLEQALKTYKEVSATEGRSEAALAAVRYFIAIHVHTTLLAPLVELAGQNETELARKKAKAKGHTMPTYDMSRWAAGAAAISVIFRHSRNGRSLSEIVRVVANALGVEAKPLIEYRRNLNRKSQQKSQAKGIYTEHTTVHFKRLLDSASSEGAFEIMVLAYLTGFLPEGATFDPYKV